MNASSTGIGFARRLLSLLLICLVAIGALGVSGCGKASEPAAGHDDKKAAAKTTKTRTKPKPRAAKTAKKPASSSGASKSAGSKKRGKLSVSDLLVKNPGRIEDLLKPKDYGYKFKYNVFKDYSLRKKEKIDNDGDGVPDIYDLDDDNDGFPDTVEIAQGFDPLNKFHHPERSNIVSGGAGDGLLPTAPASGDAVPVDAGSGSSAPSATPAASSGGDGSVGQSGVFFRGLFGIRSAKIAALKVVKNGVESMILCREGESFKGVSAGKEYLMEEINLPKEYIKVREIGSGEVFKLSFQKKEDQPRKTVASADTGGKNAKKTAAKKRAAAKGAKDKKKTAKAKTDKSKDKKK